MIPIIILCYFIGVIAAWFCVAYVNENIEKGGSFWLILLGWFLILLLIIRLTPDPSMQIFKRKKTEQ